MRTFLDVMSSCSSGYGLIASSGTDIDPLDLNQHARQKRSAVQVPNNRLERAHRTCRATGAGVVVVVVTIIFVYSFLREKVFPYNTISSIRANDLRRVRKRK